MHTKELHVSLGTFSEAVDLLYCLGFNEDDSPDETYWNFTNRATKAFAVVKPVEQTGGRCTGYICFSFPQDEEEGNSLVGEEADSHIANPL